MTLIKWLDKYSVNIKEMDEQHKIWIGFINDLYEAKQADKDVEVLSKLLEDVFDYTETHFTREEELMKQYDYPDYQKHKAIHDNLIKDVVSLHKRYGSKSIDLPIKVLHLLSNWLANHIMTEDKKYSEYLK